MRWKSVFGGLALVLVVTAGCKQNCFMTKDDLEHYQSLMPANLDLETKPQTANPVIPPCPSPMTLYDLNRKERFLSLAEAISLALENGTVGFQSTNIPSASSITFGDRALDSSLSFTGRGVTGSDYIRVLALDPAIVGAGIESSLSKFDAVWTSSLNWTTTDTPISTPLQTFQAGGAGLNAIMTEAATFSTALLKPLPTGGVAGVTFNTNYQFTNLPARVNPSYQPSLQFQFEQPLLQNFGTEINQLTATHPGSILTPGVFNPQPSPEGILITRLRFDEQRAEFERNVNFMLFNVEVAYWNLYGAYWNLYAQEQALRFAFEAWRLTGAKFQAGRVTLGDLAQSRGQYELFRTQRLQAVDQVLEEERQLRKLIGLPVDDGTRLVPSDAPSLSPYQPDWDSALQEALALRPEVYLARQEVKASQLALIVAKNQLLPDLRFTSTYDVNSTGNRLDGPDANNAFRNLASDRFHNWSLGLRWNMPIGFRNANANVRVARLQLARSYGVLVDTERKARDFLGQQYRHLPSYYEQIRSNRAQREAFAEQLRVKFEEYRAGRSTLDIVLEAQRFYAQALSAEFNAVVLYNNGLAAWEFGKGTILHHDNVVISEGPLPGCVQLRAAEHERERTASLVVHERAKPIIHPPCQLEAGQLGLPQLPGDKAVPLPSLLKDVPPTPDTTGLSTSPSALPPGGPTSPVSGSQPLAPPPAAPLPATANGTAAPKQLPATPTGSVKPAALKKPSDFGTLRSPDAPKQAGPPSAPVPVDSLSGDKSN
jgi:hypothetical protein